MRSSKDLSLVSLFSGAGGLDVGLETAGFRASLCVEIDQIAQTTLRLNRPKWRLSEPSDINILARDPKAFLRQAGLDSGDLALLAGGPPCQPFSKAGYWSSGDSKRLDDPRAHTLRGYLKIVEYALPKVLLLENVRGLAFKGKEEGLGLLFDGIERINRKYSVNYQPIVFHINAADYGVPQLRERVFLIAHRDGLPFKLPQPTHGPKSDSGMRYMNAWDALGDLDMDVWPKELSPRGKWADLLPSIPEGENYLWHTRKGNGLQLFPWRGRYWSFLLKLAKDRPSWTIQAQPGPSTGPFHWRSRMLSIQELARLQTFPDDYQFCGAYRDAYRQIGNAVPPALGELFGLEIRRQFFQQRPRRSLRLLPSPRLDCPPAEKPRAVPRKYHELEGDYSDHPGTGLGPGALRRFANRH